MNTLPYTGQDVESRQRERPCYREENLQGSGMNGAREPFQGIETPLYGLFGHQLPIEPWQSGRGIRYTRRWHHASHRGELRSLQDHVVSVTYSGTTTVIVEDGTGRRTGQLRRGSVTILPAGSVGSVDFSGERECSQVFIPELAMTLAQEAGFSPSGSGLQFRLAIVDPILFSLVDMLTSSLRTHIDHPGFREQCVELLCTHLAVAHCQQTDVEARTDAPTLANWQLRKIEGYMRSRLHAPLSLQDIAGQVDLSRHYLCTAFRHTMGIAPYEYLTELRMDRARQLLAETNRAISEVAEAVGYSTASAFTACFRRHTGTTPRKYRDDMR